MYRLVLIILFFVSSIKADTCMNGSSIDDTYFNDEIIGLYLSSLNFESSESNVLLFDYAIQLPFGELGATADTTA